MRIYARNTKVERISNKLADAFIRRYHRQGLCNFGGEQYNVGLYYKDQLVGEASFSNPRTSAKCRVYQQELVRMTFKTNVQIVGGASKLIRFYIDDYKPRNFFTYQTRSGKNTDVYALSGMTLRRHGRDKHVLVKNGYTYDEAVKEHQFDGTKYLYLDAHLINLGPDQILKTKIGSKYDSNGKRLTNRDLLIKYCGYHEEIVPGDDLYDYNNDHYVHYIYKIINSDPNDNCYYIGRHSDYTDTPLTDNDLLTDGYCGSGGSRYKAWKNKTQAAGFTLIKQILAVQHSWTENVQAEKQFIGNKYKVDPYCLNQVAGGVSAIVGSVNNFITYTMGICPKHGRTKFKNNFCCACLGEKALHEAVCPIHGKTMFNGKSCLECQSKKVWHEAICPIHGKTMFSGNTCAKCAVAHAYSMKVCPIHGKTKFNGDQCLKCSIDRMNSKALHMGICPIHGKTKFKGDKCCKCSAKKRFHMGICSIHGKTKFTGNECNKCRNAKQYHMGICPIHGKTKFRKDKCCKCASAKRFHMGTCPIHGRVKFSGKKCTVCLNRASIKHKWCDKCQKITGWNGNTCMSCVARKATNKSNKKVSI